MKAEFLDGAPFFLDGSPSYNFKLVCRIMLVKLITIYLNLYPIENIKVYI